MKRFFIELYVKIYNTIPGKKITYYFIHSDRQLNNQAKLYPSPNLKCTFKGKDFTEARNIENGYPKYKDCKLIALGTLEDVTWPKNELGFAGFRLEDFMSFSLFSVSTYMFKPNFDNYLHLYMPTA